MERWQHILVTATQPDFIYNVKFSSSFKTPYLLSKGSRYQCYLIFEEPTKNENEKEWEIGKYKYT